MEMIKKIFFLPVHVSLLSCRICTNLNSLVLELKRYRLQLIDWLFIHVLAKKKGDY